jgi:hypothetical protein
VDSQFFEKGQITAKIKTHPFYHVTRWWFFDVHGTGGSLIITFNTQNQGIFTPEKIKLKNRPHTGFLPLGGGVHSKGSSSSLPMPLNENHISSVANKTETDKLLL